MKKRIFVLFLFVILSFSFAACESSKDNNAASDTINSLDIQSPETEIENSSVTTVNNGETTQSGIKTKYHNLDLFITEYNKYAKTLLSGQVEIDIQSDKYYKNEFRLNAFQNAPAYLAEIGDSSIELINTNYEGMFGSDIRIYASVDTLEITKDIFESFCKAGDADITQEDFDEFYEFYSLDSGDCRITIGDVSGYVFKREGKYDIMLDATPDYFDQE